MTYLLPSNRQSAQILTAFCLSVISLFTANGEALQVTEAQIKGPVVAYAKKAVGDLFSKADQQYVNVTTVSIPGLPLNFPEASSFSEIKITTDSQLGQTYSERGVVKVHIEDSQGNRREIGVPIQISIKKPVWIVKNPITANAPLRLSDLSLELRDVSHSYGFTVGQERELSNYVARTTLGAGDILDTRKMIIPPDVSCNDDIRITLNSSNGMSVTVPGVALSNGRLGEMIRVRQSVFQRKYYTAKVIDRNRVLVEI